jgi:hypothetical protein
MDLAYDFRNSAIETAHFATICEFSFRIAAKFSAVAGSTLRP